jgi:hypothetical protein
MAGERHGRDMLCVNRPLLAHRAPCYSGASDRLTPSRGPVIYDLWGGSYLSHPPSPLIGHLDQLSYVPLRQISVESLKL